MHQPRHPLGAAPPWSQSALAPVRPRVDGWTAERQRTFLDALARTRSVGRAAEASGMSRTGAYRLRARADAVAFAAAWDAALVRPETHASRTAHAQAALLWDRAWNGRVVPVIRHGEQVGHVIRPDNIAAVTLLRRLDRATSGDRAGKRKPRPG